MKRMFLRIGAPLKKTLAAAGVVLMLALPSIVPLHARPRAVLPSMAVIGLVGMLKKKGAKLDEATEGFVKELDEVLGEALEGMLTPEAFDEKMAAFKKEHGSGLDEEQMKQFDDMVESTKKTAEALQKLKDGGVRGDASKSLHELIVDALTEKNETLENIAANPKSNRESVSLRVKAANSVITTLYASNGANAYVPAPYVVPGVHTTPLPENNVMQFVNVGTSDSPNVTWVNESPVEGDAGYTAEGDLKNQVAWKYTNQQAKSANITAFVKVTTQALRNIGFLANRIDTRLREIIRKKVETEVIKGDGAAGHITGMVTAAPAFTTTAFNASVDTPNIFDVISVMAGQVEQLDFEPNVAMLNGVVIRKMKLMKDGDGRYLLPPFTTPDGTRIDDMVVVKNNNIPITHALVGDFNRFNVLIVDDLKIDIGLDGDDFTHNRRTILGEMELVSFMSDVDKGAFVYDEIADVQTAIAAP